MIYIFSLLLFVFPGYVLLSIFWKSNPFSFWEKVGISSALSLSIYPLLHLWFHSFHISPGHLLSWGVICISVFMFIWIKRQKLFSLDRWKETINQLLKWKPGKQFIFPSLLLVVVGCLVVSRICIIKNMTGPAWGDSVHHTHIVQLLRENAGLFQSWAPYAPIESFSYHFGFHSAVSSWAGLTGIPSPQAVLIAGQIFNVLAVLALYPLVLRLTGTKWAALAGLIFAGLLFPLPGFFVNWGRYTQLAAQILLPVVLLLLHFLSVEKTRPHLGLWVLLGLLLSGLALTHYMVAFLGGAAFMSWFFWSFWDQRKSLSVWFNRWGSVVLVVIVSFLSILPWILHIYGGRMMNLTGIKGKVSSAGFYGSHSQIWKNTDMYFSDFFWIGGLLILIFLFYRRRRLSLPLAGWGLISFVFANPRLLGLPGTGVVGNEILIFAVYIPLALLFGWFIGVLWKWSLKDHRGILPVVLSAALLVSVGMKMQLNIVKPFFQMLSPSDLKTFGWIRENIPEKACFLVNGFLTHEGKSVAGSDSGWWLSFYTQRENTVPPALYTIEKLSPGVRRSRYPQIVKEVRRSGGRPKIFREVLYKHGITHVFLGSKRGGVSYDPFSRLIPVRWLKDNKDFNLVFQAGKTQVWKFNRKRCQEKKETR